MCRPHYIRDYKRKYISAEVPTAHTFSFIAHSEVQHIFTITTPAGKYTRRVSQGVLNTTGYFQDAVTEVLDDLDWEVLVDDTVWL